MKYKAFIVVYEVFLKKYNMAHIYYMVSTRSTEDNIISSFDGPIYVEPGERAYYLPQSEKQIVYVSYLFFESRGDINGYISKVIELVKDSECVVYIPNLADASSENDFDIVFPRAYARAIKKPIEIIHEWEFDNYFKYRR